MSSVDKEYYEYLMSQEKSDLAIEIMNLEMSTSNNRIAESIKENNQLKQQLHELPKKIVEEIRDVAGDYWEECGNVPDLNTLTMEDFDEILDAILEKFGGKDEINND